jgi:ubiquinol-cytochrome c reductase core subunit 2
LGASHVIRNAAGQSTTSATAFGITRNLQQIGGSLSATSDREVIAYNVDVSRDGLETALEFLKNASTGQLFKPWEIEDSLPRLKRDVATIPDQVRALELLHQAVYRIGLGNSIYIPKKRIGKLSSETLQHYFSSNFTTNRAAVVGVGVDHQILVGYAQNLGLESGEGKDQVSVFNGATEVRKERGGSWAHVAVATQGAGLNNRADTLAYAILQASMGSGPATKYGSGQSTLSRAVSSPIKALNISYTDSGLFGFVLSAKGKDAGKTVESAVKALKSGKISSEDIARGKAILKSAVLFNSDNTSGLIEDIGNQAVLLGKIQSAGALAAEIDSVDSRDVECAASKVASGKLSIGAVGNLETVPFVNQIN